MNAITANAATAGTHPAGKPILAKGKAEPLVDRLTGAPVCIRGVLENTDKKHLPALALSLVSPKSVLKRFQIPYKLAYNMLSVKNWARMTALEFGRIGAADAVFRNGTRLCGITGENVLIFQINRTAAFKKVPIRASGEFLEFEFGGRKIALKYPGDSLGDVPAVFFENVYGCAGCRGKQVLDIGAHIGDSAIYFALRGAGKVYAIEPYPFSFGIARENVMQNGLSGKIEVLNAGVASKNGKVCIDPAYRNTVGSSLTDFGSGNDIPIYTLDALVRKFGLKDAVLKLDCEGGEYCAIAGSPPQTLRNFSEIVVEYHYGYRNLRHALETAGFSVRVGKPSYHYNAGHPNPHIVQGFLSAKREG